MVATPDGVRCGQDDEITETLPTYLLANLEGGWKIFAFVGPDELALAREHDSLEGELLPVDWARPAAARAR